MSAERKPDWAKVTEPLLFVAFVLFVCLSYFSWIPWSVDRDFPSLIPASVTDTWWHYFMWQMAHAWDLLKHLF